MQFSINRNKKGFTIIEVMIVLAIAALILLVVFLAVPALQRSQRNNARKSDSSRMAATVVDFTSNNSSGSLPTSAADCTTLLNSSASLAQYNPLACVASAAPIATAPVAAATLVLLANGGAGTAPGAQNNAMVLSDQSQCGSGNGVLIAGSAKQAALLYALESGGTWTWGCVNPQ